MINYGNLNLGDTLDFKFTTVDASGVPTTLAGTPSLAVYGGNSTTEITSGITLTVDFDAKTGLNHVRVAATTGNGFAAGNYNVVIAAGTVGGSSVANEVVGFFSVNARYAGLDLDNILLAGNGPLPAFGIIDRGTAQAAAAGTITLRAGFSATDDVIIGATVYVYSSTNGLHGRAVVADWDNTTKVATLAANWTQTPTGTILYFLYATPASNFDSVAAAVTQMRTAFELDGSVYRLTTNALEQSAAAGVILRSSTVTTTGTTSTFEDSSITEAGVDALKFLGIRWTGGPNAGRTCTVYASNGTAVTVTPAMPNAISSGHTYELLRAAPNLLAPVTHTGSTIPAVTTAGTVAGAVTVGTLNDKTGLSLSNAGIDAIFTRPITEPGGVFSWDAANLRNIIAFVGAANLNETQSTQTQLILRNAAGTGNIAVAPQSVVNGVYTRGKFA